MTNPFYLSKFWKNLRADALDRDGHRCTVPGCTMTGNATRLTVDHITTRPNVPYPTALDILSNLRTLCATHDGQVKEQASGERRRGGQTFVRGCDASGNPLDPRHLWNRRVGP
jgi:5-methylcytosine-specific restriction protein A